MRWQGGWRSRTRFFFLRAKHYAQADNDCCCVEQVYDLYGLAEEGKGGGR